ncbi:TIGR03086 family metal-binding protein [Blastococcus sp. PRF04-17]|uniref:TIGR03086 family metal-binding protein n=1 Tax=Blastococcus sp. PRF04-17 TaxID=2933797 RepID=UPI001FF140DC|nr:TIGR03086 family metal-binding protein [Blastococcus sp. PRF04-17]UOY01848.1 TIGR03086 family metal-binding protein [Blastococcus sp. PRF04-17]
MDLDLAPTVTEVARVVRGVRDDQLAAPTPCTDMSVAALLDHLDGLALAFRLAAEKAPPGGAPQPSAEKLTPDWRTRIPARLESLAAAWREPGAWDGETEVGGVQMPGEAAGLVGLNEVLVHGWDLAVATGQAYAADPVAAQACVDLVQDFAVAAPEARDEIYGPVVPVPGEAPVLDRLLGAAGRDPGWTPR